jgi:hypothetical protein
MENVDSAAETPARPFLSVPWKPMIYQRNAGQDYQQHNHEHRCKHGDTKIILKVNMPPAQVNPSAEVEARGLGRLNAAAKWRWWQPLYY